MTTLYDLPLEMLTKIFSYLDTDEILKVAGVSRKFREVSETPSLWEKVILRLNPAYFTLFCNFLTKNHLYPQMLSLSFQNLRILTRNERKSLKNLFFNSKQLSCLTVENLDLRFVSFPTNLKHLSVNCDTYPDHDPMCANVYVVYFIHKALVECHQIEKICVYAGGDKSKKAKNCLSRRVNRIVENASKLTSLSIFPMCSELMPMIKYFSNLKELGLYFCFDNFDHLAKESDFVPIAGFPHLELLYLRCEYELLDLIFKSFKIYKLPTVRHFSFIAHSYRELRENDFVHIHRMLPNLSTFYTNGRCTQNVYDFFKFISTCLTLKGIYYDFIGSDKALFTFINDILRLGKKRLFENICFCQALERLCYLDGRFIANTIPSKIREGLLNYSCGKIHGKELKFSECFCRFPMLEDLILESYIHIPYFSTFPYISNMEHNWSTSEDVEEIVDDDSC